MKLSIRNFQSIKKAELDIEPLTVIVGPSDSGKSAIIRALAAALWNTPGNDFISWGSKKAEVDFQDGTDHIHYEKGSAPKYTINGHDYSAIGRGPFAEVEAVGYRELQADSRKARPQLSRQHDAPFLISDDYPPTSVAALLGDLSDSAIVNKAKRVLEKDIKQLTSELNYKQGELDDLKKAVLHYRDFDNIEDKYAKLKEQLSELVNESASFAEIKLKINELRDLQNYLKAATGMIEKLRKDVDSLQSTINHQQSTLNEFKDLKTQALSIDRLSTDISAAQAAVVQFREVYASLGDLDALEKTAAEYKEIQERIKILRTLQEIIKKITDFMKAAGEKMKSATLFLSEGETLIPTMNVASVAHFEGGKASELEREIEKYRTEVEKVSKELSKIEICPLCEQRMHS